MLKLFLQDSLTQGHRWFVFSLLILDRECVIYSAESAREVPTD
jgi:hypothetical protein